MPQTVLLTLEAGNARFAAGAPVRHDVHEALRMVAAGMAPPAAILSCIDSRVPVETVFDLPIGSAFSARVAGNVVGPDVVGSLEFACAVAGSRLVVVLGHTGCGAVKGACDGVELGALTGILARIRPAVEAVAAVRPPADSARPSSDDGFVDAVATANVALAMAALLDQSVVLRDLVAAGRVGLVGAMYDVRTGVVTFLAHPATEPPPSSAARAGAAT